VIYEYKGKLYPDYIKNGNACAHVLPFAEHFCRGDGLDIGGTKDWHLPGATVVNIDQSDGHDALNLPNGKYDFIFSSHTLEHVERYVDALEHWKTRLKYGGTLFMYLPHPDMEYWRPQNNRKHAHLFYPEDMKKTLADLGFKQILCSERDLYWSFAIVGFND
jgi:SAM-dependent methyltransferase